MKILLLGATGQVGTELHKRLSALGDLRLATRSGLLADGSQCEHADFDQPDSLAALVERLAPDLVVNAAAYTAVDQAEREPRIAHRINAQAPAVLADACRRGSAKLVHYSTDYVFNGRATRPYREDDPVAPLGVYGASKRAGEEAILASGARHLIIRTAWVYAAHGHNFLRTMLRLAAEREELRVVDDQIGSPTPAGLIADISARLLADDVDADGLVHLTTLGQTSWHGFAEAIVDGGHRRGLLDRRPRIVPISSAEFPTAAERPRYSVLDCGRLQQTFGIGLPGWHDALGDVLDQMPART
jgi:dTDP-4-dehydrorhamnose reductase